MATAFLLERVCRRAGLNAWNAALATLLFVLSPLYLPWAYTFMTDISGVLSMVLCLYMCLRAVEAQSENSAIAWIALAALVNALGGTARQVAWLGVLVMVPCTLWLLRKNRRVLLAGSIAWIAGVAIVAAAVHWFARQPYCIPQPIPHRITLDLLKNLARAFLGVAGIVLLYSMPVLLFFAAPLRTWKRWAVAAASILLVFPLHWLKVDKWPVNAVYNLFTSRIYDSLSTVAASRSHLAAAQHGLRVLVTARLLVSSESRYSRSMAALAWQSPRTRLSSRSFSSGGPGGADPQRRTGAGLVRCVSREMQ